MSVAYAAFYFADRNLTNITGVVKWLFGSFCVKIV